jgi:Uncharacterized protein conserved in bacteria (DUF2188)
MAEPMIHTTYASGAWQNKREGDDTVISRHETKAEAVAAGRAEAMRVKTEHIIHDQEGVIRERHSYGNDPADRPG